VLFTFEHPSGDRITLRTGAIIGVREGHRDGESLILTARDQWPAYEEYSALVARLARALSATPSEAGRAPPARRAAA
jgi:hypothetical protein